MPFPGFHKKKKTDPSVGKEPEEPKLEDILKKINGVNDAGKEENKEPADLPDKPNIEDIIKNIKRADDAGKEEGSEPAGTPEPDSLSSSIAEEAPVPASEEPRESVEVTAHEEPEERVISAEDSVEPVGSVEGTAPEIPGVSVVLIEDSTDPELIQEHPEEPEKDEITEKEEIGNIEEPSDQPVREPVKEREEEWPESVEKAETTGKDEGGGEDLSYIKKKKKTTKARIQDEKKGLLLKKKIEKIRLYDFGTDGPLVDPILPEGYVLRDEYWIHEGRSKVLIAKSPENHLEEYLLYEPKLSSFERELAERLYEDMRDVLILTDEEILEDRESVLMDKMNYLLHEYKVKIEDDALFKLQYYLLRNFLGWSKLDSLMFDPNIEDISCDGSDIPLFLYHRKFRNIKTNISFDEDTLYSLAILLAQRSGKHISVSQPMLDATLPDGSRLQLTLGKVVTSRGTSFTIRKFREEPFTPIELIDYGTFNVDQLVYFWLAIENNKSLLFVGGTASGKTTSLNAVSLFIPPLSKVVSIEDTREITLFHDNWLATVTREAVVETSGAKVDMFDLLKAAMRQRPEYILVGEVRGVEAQTLFQAMNTGHTTFSTLHANSVDAAIHRLENPPLNVPRNMVQALDIVSIQALVYRGQDRVRRAMEIVEIAGIDPGTGNLRVNTVFEYDPVKDIHTYSGRSQVYSKILEMRGWSREEMNEEIEKRRRIIQAMHDQGIIDYINVTKIFQAYFINSSNVLENIGDLKKAFL
ncbi:type II secretion system protein E [Methanolacinia petrolearia DSM 11571]|uniref:Type II secretion system protein E n=1 Tax=Methanolacinia petrolearia (strain DSM 11571 / OCM 486 / SEBR 4847) TaxID=679926 RepID=E1REQ0_METP4|nr:ATPase, T2SS/T4P/T4SS family [Methanolacinia petrolearia]ADN34997.1 type II secretion system protein E [Methanolacinia petrolearia DSM 11571]